MGTPNSELLAQLRGAISSWTAEVGAAQQGLSQQIDGANTQLSRLLAVLQERQQLTVALAHANDELNRLKQAMGQEQLPAGAVTRYTVAYTPAPAASGDGALRELGSTIGRLQAAVQSWTTQVTGSQSGLLSQFATANRQLAQLLDILAPGAGAAPATVEPSIAAQDPALLDEVEQLRHENRILTSEVHALNIEMESFRLEQENFASANLAAETERVVKHRREHERLESALAERDAELQRVRREHEELTRDADLLRKEAARLQISEERLQSAVDLQRAETAQHVAALSALTREMEALRRAFLGEDVQLAVHEGDLNDPAEGADGGEALEEAEGRIASLESRLTQMELERQEVAVLEERIAALKEQLVVLEQRPPVEALQALQQRIDSLEAAIAAAPTAEQLAALQLEIEQRDKAQSETDLSEEDRAATAERSVELESRIAELDAELAELSTRPTTEEYAAGAERSAELESRIAVLESELAELSTRPTAEELSESAARAVELELRIAELESELAELSTRPTAEELSASAARAVELELRIAELESELAELSTRPTAEELSASASRASELESRIAELDADLAELSTRPTAEDLSAQRERVDTLERALEHLRADSEAASEMAGEATALREQLSQMQLLMSELNGRPESGELEMAQVRIEALEDEVQALKAGLAASEQTPADWMSAERAGLQSALAAMENELATMKRREEETVTTARTLLVEMETHRTYEAAQATALSQSRNEASRLQDALTERQQQLAAVGAALAAAETARNEMAVALADATDNRVDQASLAELYGAVERLEGEKAALAKTGEEAERLKSLVEAQTAELEVATQAIVTLENQARERDRRIVALEADLSGHAESLMKATALEEALQIAGDRVEMLEASLAAARDVEPDGDLTAALTASEALVQAQLRELEGLQESRQTAEDRIAELEQALEGHVREHSALKAKLAELTAQFEGNAAELESLRARESARRDAISDARAEAEAARAGAAEHEQNLAVIAAELEEKKAVLELLESEKALLSEESQARRDEIREAMAHMSQVLHERDELSEELEVEKSRRERIFAGTAGAGKNAVEALELREERARQQEILLSELAQPGESRSLGDILVNAGILTHEQLGEALDEQQKDPTQLLGTILIERDFTTDDAIAQAVACQLEKPVVNPMEVHIQQDALDALHRDLCTWHVCIPLRITPDRLVVAMANPLDESAIMKLRDVSQREITPVVGTPSHIMGAIDNYYGTF